MGIRAPECDCPVNVMSKDDRVAMKLMEESCYVKDQRFTVGIPWKYDPLVLRNNYALAERRLLSLERKLLRDEKRAEMYNSVIHEYEQNGWCKALKETELWQYDGHVYYLPHHGIFRPDHPSTPLRVVFDPAAQYGLIVSLLGVLLCFREDVVAFTGDVSKMYLQINLPERDAHLHRFLWRDLDQSKPPQKYVLNRVTFGGKASPDMTSSIMLQLAKRNEQTHPGAALIINRDIYMDDFIHSCETNEQARQRITEMEEVLAQGSFKVKEWHCSSQEPEPSVATTKSETETNLVSLDKANDVKTLGMCWEKGEDVLRFVVKPFELSVFTKRSVLSRVAMLYDPLGLAAAVTITARIAIQDIWRFTSLKWDDILPQEMESARKVIFNELNKLQRVSFPRCIKPLKAEEKPELHVFCDASAKAYGAAAYLRWPQSEGCSVQLVSAKARVAPLKQSTIPRLELMAALVASRLAGTITAEFKQQGVKVTFWKDSKVVLQWIRSESIVLKTFVGVRVAEIQDKWETTSWRHVPTDLNPADDLSRGIPVEQLEGRWKVGPHFLKHPEDDWPKEEGTPEVDDSEYKQQRIVNTVTRDPFLCWERFSSWPKLVRVMAYCLRFVHNLKASLENRTRQPGDVFSLDELQRAEHHCITTVQATLGDWKSKYLDLNPFEEGTIIRVGGPFRKAPLTHDQKHPILLPANHHVSMLIMRSFHVKMGHVGSERTLGESRRKFWIVRGRNLAKQIVRACITCHKLKQPPHYRLMGDLPKERLQPYEPPFHVTGVDLFGPFILKLTRNTTMKAWGAIFTCATTRAIHLEIVHDQSAKAFLQALRRFACYHGWPSTIISDNGGSFTGTRKELKTLVTEGRKVLQDFAMLHQLKWIFTTPLSSHQGGIYESLIKQAKGAIKVVIGEQTLTWGELSTAFAEVACLVNSRPLGHSSGDPNDPQPLTPNHFLLGRATNDIPQGPFQKTANLHKRFEFVQLLVNQFWKRFTREYLPTLQVETSKATVPSWRSSAVGGL